MLKRKFLYRLISVSVALVFLFVMGISSFAQEETTEEPVATEEVAVALTDVEIVQYNLDMTWMITAGFLVFFMQAGFAMLEGGFIRHTGVINSMAENFMDACITALVFFIVGYSIAYAGDGLFGNGIIPIPATLGIGTELVIDPLGPGNLDPYADWFFQFAFAGAAATIATGAMAERTDFRGKMIYSAILGAIIYPVVIFWSPWNGGFLAQLGMVDFAGSTIVHQTGGVLALVGAAFVGPRVGRVFGNPPVPSNLMMASLGTFILWFGWYGFNVGSTLAASDVHLMGLVAVNTTLAAAAGALTAMGFVYVRSGHWNMGFILNGSLAGLVGITAGAAFVSPVASIIIGLTAGFVVVLAVDAVEASKIDDAVGAFAVHGACGMLGTLAIGFWGVPELLGTENGGLFVAGGNLDLLIAQAISVIVVTVWAAGTGIVMFGSLRALGILRMHESGDEIGIDLHEHEASLYGDILLTLPKPVEGPVGD
ncbi:MAG: ammonium transporter [Anaerolineae bacterium]